jgi:hypothetical protein
MVKVRYSEGVAIHTDPESCAGHCREAVREALTGGRTGEVLSGESNLVRGADAVVACRRATGAGPSSRGPWPPRVVNRDRGTPHGAAPPTPPYVRVRIRRFGELCGLLGAREGRPSAAKDAFGNAMARAGLLLIRHGPCGLPAVGAARATSTPRLISCANLVRPRFHCFQATARSRRLAHCSRARNTVGVSQKPK